MPDALVPLLGSRREEAEFARGAAMRHTHADFLRAVRALSQALPRGRHVLNFCRDRYLFAVGFGACLVSGKISLLPSTRTAAVLKQIEEHYPDTFCLHDGEGLGELCSSAGDADRPQIRTFAFPVDLEAPGQEVPDMPQIPSTQVAAHVFTSGSTGSPQPQTKTWGSLVASARAEASALEFGRQAWALVGTVPSQHMYGFESLILLALHGGASLWTGHPFYPADIAAAIALVPRPRMLVTSPAHLRALLAAQIAYPPLDRLLSATAPLPHDLAQQAERTFQAALFEIYGSTETGQMASRRSVQTPLWHLFPQVEIEQRDGATWARGGHILKATPLADVIEIRDPGHFVLVGRHSDLINIAGKRSSLAHVNEALLSIPGVDDGCMFVPDCTTRPGKLEAPLPDSTRLCAIVVAPRHTPAQILLALRAKLDPAFLPRPIIVVESLPRNATGKLPRESLQQILVRHLQAGQDRLP
jgi:acyl-coenzyme A synthetase/AMP-(fatty) acid ligase